MKSKLFAENISCILQYTLMIIGAIIFVFPFIWMILKSLMDLKDLNYIPPRLFPSHLQIKAYFEIWKIKPLHLYAINTMIIIFFSVIGATVSSTLCAFGFARLRFPFKKTIFIAVLSTLMLPTAVTMIPVYILFSKLGWINTFLPLTIPWFLGGGAFNIFLLRQFLSTIPKDFDEAARIYGANTWYVFSRIYVPMIKSAVIVVVVQTFIGVWNDFMGPLIYLNKESLFTLSLGLYNLSPSGTGTSVSNWMNTAQLMASSCIAIIPVVIVFFVAQKRLISGVSIASGIKA